MRSTGRSDRRRKENVGGICFAYSLPEGSHHAARAQKVTAQSWQGSLAPITSLQVLYCSLCLLYALPTLVNHSFTKLTQTTQFKCHLSSLDKTEADTEVISSGIEHMPSYVRRDTLFPHSICICNVPMSFF